MVSINFLARMDQLESHSTDDPFFHKAAKGQKLGFSRVTRAEGVRIGVVHPSAVGYIERMNNHAAGQVFGLDLPRGDFCKASGLSDVGPASKLSRSCG